VDTPPLEKGDEGGFKRKAVTLHREFSKEYGGIVILKISPIPSFPKRGFRVSKEN
jgi:hypothetical protein